MLFIPIRSGMGPVNQFVVPVAGAPDTDVSHRTLVTPTLSEAVPEIVIELADV